eukprot:GILK01005475.1.p1 GENE.GILK01005475.1~~GILK01005475.1.p1  ORF type:complete len:231 (-),score=20.63 GILK01005475.1:190-882(-)
MSVESQSAPSSPGSDDSFPSTSGKADGNHPFSFDFVNQRPLSSLSNAPPSLAPSNTLAGLDLSTLLLPGSASPYQSLNAIPPNDQNYTYYQEYCRLFLANEVLTAQMKQLVQEKNMLQTRLSKLENSKRKADDPLNGADDTPSEKKKRHRRTAGEIERVYKCTGDGCSKSYGSEGSLNQHIKIKHPEHWAQTQQHNQRYLGLSAAATLGILQPHLGGSSVTSTLSEDSDG